MERKEDEVSWLHVGLHMLYYLGLSNGSRNKNAVRVST